MNCREASIQISLHVGDDLPEAEVTPLEDHLEHCAVCQVEYESYASARDALQSLKGESMATTNLWSELEAQLDKTAPVLGTGRRWGSRPLWTALAAALVLAVSAQFWLPTSLNTDSITTPGSSSLQDISVGVGVGQVGVGPDTLADIEDPQSEQVPSEDIFDILRGAGEPVLDEEDLDNPMIAAPASRRSF